MVFYELVARLFSSAALTSLGRIARLPVEIVLILAFAAVSYRFMETPINRFKKYFPYWGRAPGLPAAAHLSPERTDTTSTV
jgi:peptidoglycan/LPS O-acetylase OafA/YrhL